ncbi:uncharacterized protein LOC107261872 [Ricinus communis]|uniref:uncharacterized protein LOC107261872 n=1 Tax=Ricinus communis TaxID=3988 RepID=UPI00201A4857|nr:uncharacterized protein LOC107261872 [Ricinus communis]
MGHMARECPCYLGRLFLGSSRCDDHFSYTRIFQGGSRCHQEGRSFGGRSTRGRSGDKVQGQASGSQQSGRRQARVFTLTLLRMHELQMLCQIIQPSRQLHPRCRSGLQNALKLL